MSSVDTLEVAQFVRRMLYYEEIPKVVAMKEVSNLKALDDKGTCEFDYKYSGKMFHIRMAQGDISVKELD